MPGTLAPQLRRGPATQLRVHEHQSALARVQISSGPGVEQLGDIVGG